MGSTEIPVSPIRKGYSFVPCVEPIFHDPQPPRGYLLDDPMIEQDDAVRDELFEALTREVILAALTRHDRRDAAVLQPPEQAPQFGSQDRHVREAREHRLDRVEHETLRVRSADRVIEADEERFEIVVARLLDVVPLDRDEFDRQLLAPDQVVEIEPERSHVFHQLPLGFFEGDEDARLAMFHRAAHEEFHRHQRLPRSGAAADQRGTASREAAPRDLVETIDPRRRLLHAADRHLPLRGGGRRSAISCNARCHISRASQCPHWQWDASTADIARDGPRWAGRGSGAGQQRACKFFVVL